MLPPESYRSTPSVRIHLSGSLSFPSSSALPKRGLTSFSLSSFFFPASVSLFLAADADQEALTYLEDVSVVRGGDKKSLDEFDLVFVSFPSFSPSFPSPPTSSTLELKSELFPLTPSRS